MSFSARSSRMPGCTFLVWSLNNISFDGLRIRTGSCLAYDLDSHFGNILCALQPVWISVLSFSLHSHSHLHWDQRPEFGEGFAGLRLPNFYLTTGTSGSNEILLSAWLRPNLFIFWALLALTTSLGTLPGSVWSFCHMLVNNIQSFIWTWSTCLGKVVPSVTTSCLWEHSWGSGCPCAGGWEPLLIWVGWFQLRVFDPPQANPQN